MTTLHVPIGIPASGKSTLAAQLKASNDYLVVVSSDELRQAMSLPADSTEIWPFFHQAIAASLDSGLDVSADATNLKPAFRAPYFEAGADEVVAHVLRAPFATCVTRNVARERHVPLSVMLDMQDSMDALSLTDLIRVEGFDKVFVYDEDLHSAHRFDILPEPQRQGGVMLRSIQDTTNLHKLENLVTQTRKLAGRIVNETESDHVYLNANDWFTTLVGVEHEIKEVLA